MKLKHTSKYGAVALAVFVGIAASSGVAFAKKRSEERRVGKECRL